MARVMIIDDDSQVRMVIRRTLESAGHSVSEAADGKAGLEALAGFSPDVIITDIYMPEKEGLETIIELKRDHPNVPVIAISGGSRGADLDFLPVAQRLGASFALAKPIDRDALLEAVGRLVGDTQ